jgi:hypothetical protein
MTIDTKALMELHKKATKGDWTVESEKSDGCYGSGEDTHEGYATYFIATPQDGKIVDALNSDVGCVHEEHDEDGTFAWDDVAKNNMEFIAAAHSAIPALVAENERLREVLRAIASGRYSGYTLTSNPPQDPAVRAAKIALEATAPPSNPAR